MHTLRELLANSNLARLDNRVLLSEITGFSTAQLISRDDYVLTDEQFERYQSWLKRTLSGEPLAYIVGYKEFYSHEFKVTPDTLIPRPETELLVDEVLLRAPPNAAVLDMGSGSGCIAISCKLERRDIRVTALDQSSAALKIAGQNAISLGAEIKFIHSDWYSALAADAYFDIIVSNPPYIEAGDLHLSALSYEPLSALTDFSDGLSCIRKIANQAPKFLKNNGYLLVEHGYNQGVAVREILAEAGLLNIDTLRDYAGLERITLGQRMELS
jgi:release factor glutamine methyltransferase